MMWSWSEVIASVDHPMMNVRVNVDDNILRNFDLSLRNCKWTHWYEWVHGIFKGVRWVLDVPVHSSQLLDGASVDFSFCTEIVIIGSPYHSVEELLGRKTVILDQNFLGRYALQRICHFWFYMARIYLAYRDLGIGGSQVAAGFHKVATREWSKSYHT